MSWCCRSTDIVKREWCLLFMWRAIRYPAGARRQGWTPPCYYRGMVGRVGEPADARRVRAAHAASSRGRGVVADHSHQVEGSHAAE